MEISNIIAALAAIVTVLVSYFGIRKQLRADLYAHYSRLYYDLMLEMMKCDGDPERQKAVAAIYIDLCSEEFQLRKQKKVDKKTWKQWREGIQYSLHQEPYLSVWQQKSQTDYYDDDFKEFVVYNSMPESCCLCRKVSFLFGIFHTPQSRFRCKK